MQLKQISKLYFQISPMSGRARSIRELYFRATTPKAAATNPQCEITHNVRFKGDNFVEVTFANKVQERIPTEGLRVEEILGRINAVAEQMDMEERLKAAGLHGQQVESQWLSGAGRETDMGSIKFTPRQV